MGKHENHVFISDVDGVINPMNPADPDLVNWVTVERPRWRKSGSTPKRHMVGSDTIETEVAFRDDVAAWFQEFEREGGTIIWLTFWEGRANLIADLLGVKFIDHIPFRHLHIPNEGGKVVALRDWLVEKLDGRKFVWADDVATLPFAVFSDADLHGEGLLITPTEAEGLTRELLQTADEFFAS